MTVWSSETRVVNGARAWPLATAACSKRRTASPTSGAVTSSASSTTTAGDGEPGKALSIWALACMTGRSFDMP